MGQARARGTKEERIQQALVRREEDARIFAEQERERKKRDQQWETDRLAAIAKREEERAARLKENEERAARGEEPVETRARVPLRGSRLGMSSLLATAAILGMGMSVAQADRLQTTSLTGPRNKKGYGK